LTEGESDRVALRFVNEINRHDPTTLFELMAPAFRYVDGTGQEVRGRERMRDRWAALFRRCPDYRIVIRDHLVLGSVVALFGTTSGTAPGMGEPAARNRWTVPSAWRAVVREGRVEEWQSYADPASLREPPTEPGG
jgi:hypothetical protein